MSYFNREFLDAVRRAGLAFVAMLCVAAIPFFIVTIGPKSVRSHQSYDAPPRQLTQENPHRAGPRPITSELDPRLQRLALDSSAKRDRDATNKQRADKEAAWFAELTKYGTPEGRIIRKGKFCLAFDGRTRTPRWTLELLTKEILAGPAIRDKKFTADITIPQEFRPVPLDYLEPVFDQGHAAPANDYGDQADSDATFTLSNCMPQYPELNQRTWRFLELVICNIVREPDIDAVWVLTAPIWWEPDENKHSMWIEYIGKNRVHVPSFCGKTILVQRSKAIELRAWILPNSKDVIGGINDLDKFRVSVDEWERQSGLDAWPLLEASLQEKLEFTKKLESK